MFRFARKIILAVVLLIVLLTVGLVVLFFQMDAAARHVLERGTTAALGVETRAEGVHVSLLRQSLTADSITIANPEGYEGPLLLEADSLDVGIRPRTLLNDVIEAPLIEITGLTLNVEQRNGRNNFAVVLENLQDDQDPDSQRRFQVDRVVIRDITANIEVVRQLGDLSRVTVEIPEIVLDDVANEDTQGVVIAELTRRIAPAIVAAVLERGEQIPDEMKRLLAADLADLAAEAGGDVARLIGEVGGDIGKAVQDAVNDLTNGLLNGLFNRSNNNEDAPDANENP